MVRAWFMDCDTKVDQRLEHHLSPPEFIGLDKLFETTRVEYFKVLSGVYDKNLVVFDEKSFE